MRSPVAMSKGCAPVLASYSEISLFTSSMSAVAGSYSRSVVSPREENVIILAFMFGLLWSFASFWLPAEKQLGNLDLCSSSCAVFQTCQERICRANEDA